MNEHLLLYKKFDFKLLLKLVLFTITSLLQKTSLQKSEVSSHTIFFYFLLSKVNLRIYCPYFCIIDNPKLQTVWDYLSHLLCASNHEIKSLNTSSLFTS